LCSTQGDCYRAKHSFKLFTLFGWGGDECILGLSFAQQKRHWPQNDIYDCENRITIQDDNTLIISKSSSIDGGAYSCRFVVVGNEIEFSSFIP
jgi:hypothetical protein